ncbi:MAG: hypothetical protein LBB87_01720 [Nitrososphaerota archaeon]|nr:hypothetical protein [Nitrososphaerota archaeon]
MLSEIFNCRLNDEAYGLLNKYPNMVKWWIDQAKDMPASFSGFRNHFYGAWKYAWSNYNSQHAQTSSLAAYNMLKLSKGQSIEELKYSFAIISPRIVKLEDEKLVFPTKLSKKAHIQLLPKNQTQKTLLEQTQNKYWQINQILLTPNWCTIPLTRYLNLTQEKEDDLIQKLCK